MGECGWVTCVFGKEKEWENRKKKERDTERMKDRMRDRQRKRYADRLRERERERGGERVVFCSILWVKDLSARFVNMSFCKCI